MVWNWNAPSANLGTPSEAAAPGAWPKYQDEVLLRNLKTRENALVEARDNNGNPTQYEASSEVRSTYLDHTARNFEKEADEALHAEFQDWLQGKHEANQSGNDLYTNEVGAPVRRHVAGELVGQPMDGWHHTQWGKRQLTHLDGVRDHLRKQAIKRDEAELQMNILAEYGPSNLKEAWMYFKHWVKKRPVKLSPASTTDYDHEIGTRSRGWNLPPDGDSWPNQMQVNRSGPPAPPPFNPDDDDDDLRRGPLAPRDDNETTGRPTYIPPADKKVTLGAEVQIEEAVEDAGGAVERVAEAAVNLVADVTGEVAGDALDLAEGSEYESADDDLGLPSASLIKTSSDDEYYALVDSYFGIDSGILVKAFDDWAASTVNQTQMSDAGLKDFAERLFTSAEEYALQSHDLSKKTDIAYEEMQVKAVTDMKRIVDDHIKRGTFGNDDAVQKQWSDALIREFIYRTDIDLHGNLKPRPQGSDFVITRSMKRGYAIDLTRYGDLDADMRLALLKRTASRPTNADGPNDPLYSEPYANKKRRPNPPEQRLVDQPEYHFLQADPKSVGKESILRGILSRPQQGKKRSGAEAQRRRGDPKQLFQMGYTPDNTPQTPPRDKVSRFGFADRGSTAAQGNAPYAFSKPTPSKMQYHSSPTAGSPSTTYKFGWEKE